MAEKGTKSQELAFEKVTVLKLKGVSYHIALHYLGAKYVKHDASKYRCRFALEDDAKTELESLPQTMSNVVIGEGDEDSIKAATPDAVTGKVTSDKAFKLLITDNHTLPDADSNLLGDAGKGVARPAFYRKNSKKWMKDVQPAAPFRVVVRKLFGEEGSYTQGDFEETMKVVVNLKDPVEEKSVHASHQPIKDCLNDFFEKYHKDDRNPNTGDDNALTWFKGHRKPNKSIAAVDLIKKMPYVEAAIPSVAAADSQPFTSLADADKHGTSGVKLELEAKEITENGVKVKVGVADFAFMPQPIGGDSYRFLLSLIDDSDKDIRDSKVNGAEVKLLDDQKKAVAKPRAYCTGRIVIWRHVEVRMFVYANGLNKNNVSWATIQGYYEKTFTRISEPILSTALPRFRWKWALKELWPANRAQIATLALADYNHGLFPAFKRATATTGDLVNLGKKILSSMAKRLTRPGMPEFNNKTVVERNNQLPGEGLIMLYAKSNAPKAGLLGCWMGDGCFLVCDHKNPYDLELNETTTHEMAHGLFMRHSHTATQQRWDSGANKWVPYRVGYTPSGGAMSEIQLVSPTSNNFCEDHDQKYGFHCTMTYLQEQAFCAACALSLRFYDRAEFIKENRFQKRLLKGFFEHPTDNANTAKLVKAFTLVGTPNVLYLEENVGKLKNGRKSLLMAVGPEHSYVAAKSNTKGRLNLTIADDDPISLWSSSRPAVIGISIHRGTFLLLDAKSVGTSKIKFEKAGESIELDIEVEA